MVPTIISLREKAEDIVQAELRKRGSALARLSADEMDAEFCLTHSGASTYYEERLCLQTIVDTWNKRGKN